MRILWMAAALAVCCAGAMAADDAVPQSVWHLEADGTAVHEQSQWRCPAAFGDFARDSLHVYDAYGLDVSCDYRNGNAEITLYLTRFTGGDLKDAFAEAEQAMVNKPGNAGMLTPLAGNPSFPSQRDWLHVVYAGMGGRFRTGVWFAWYGDWAFEIRASYTAAQEDAIMATMAHMTDEAAGNAGAHLDLCLKSKPPARNGKAATDKGAIMAGIIMAMVTSGPIVQKDDAGKVLGQFAATEPHAWCVEDPVQGFNLPILAWHAVDEAGKVQGFDRVSLVTLGPPPAIVSRFSTLAETLALDVEGVDIPDDRPNHIAARMDGKTMIVYGVYNGRPAIADLARFLVDYYRGKDKPLAKIDPQTNNVELYLEPKT